jgi:tRNA (adenine57-N1/adenine58-N1)-methyltransferase
MVKAEVGKSFHTHKGIVKFDDLIGKDYGTIVRSTLGVEFVALKPLLRDYIMKSARQTQINYPKDIALIVMFSGVGPGSRVVEAGTGTGALTMSIAFYVKPNGRVYSYEFREEFIETAKKNLARADLTDFVELKHKDITTGIDETDVDSVILDLAIPWLVVAESLKECGFVDVETIECLVRGMQVERGKTRPQTLMTAHTGYVTFARKAIRSEPSPSVGEPVSPSCS